MMEADQAIKLDGVAAADLEWPECPICYTEAAYGISDTCEHFFCDTCIEGSLKAILETAQFPALCPMCRAENGGKDDGKGRIEEENLTFLQQRNIISKGFQHRFLKQQTKTLNIEETDISNAQANVENFCLLPILCIMTLE